MKLSKKGELNFKYLMRILIAIILIMGLFLIILKIYRFTNG